MKGPKKLTRRQKEAVSSHGLFPKHWGLVEEMDFHLKIINRETGKLKIIDKFRR